MKTSKFFKTMLLVFCCLLVASMAMAGSIEKVMQGKITKIDGNRLTIRDASGKTTIFESKDAAQFKVGEMVKIDSGRITKVGTLPDPLPDPAGIIVNIHTNVVSLTPENDKTALHAIGVKTILGLKVGDKVKIQNCECSKIGTLPDPLPGPTGKKGTLPDPLPDPVGIITRIDRNKVIVAREDDMSKTIAILVKSTKGLRVKDKIKIQNCELLKIGLPPQPLPRPVVPAK